MAKLMRTIEDAKSDIRSMSGRSILSDNYTSTPDNMEDLKERMEDVIPEDDLSETQTVKDKKKK